MPDLTIHKQYQINLPKEKLFEAWVSPDTVISPVDRIEVEPREGGVMRLIVDMPEGESVMTGKFQTFSYPSHLVYSWEWDNDGEITQIEVTFNEIDSGTEVNIIHSGFIRQESLARHDAGWDSYVEGVVQLLQAA